MFFYGEIPKKVKWLLLPVMMLWPLELELELERSAKNEMLEMVKDISEMANIHYIRQKEPRGLGHAILAAKHFIGNEVTSWKMRTNM